MKYTIVVVSDHDLSLHDRTELIDDKSYSTWKRAHHECTFTASLDSDLDAQMREAVAKHVKTHHIAYAIDPTEDIGIYPFARHGADFLKPTAGKWVPCQGPFNDSPHPPEFIYILPSKRHTKDILLFIKHVTVIPLPPGPPTECVLSYRGTLSLPRETVLNERLNHIRRMCSATVTQQMQLVQISYPILEVRVLVLSKSVEDLGLQTGTVLFLVPKDLLPEQLRILASIKVSGYSAEDPSNDPAFLQSFLFDQTTRGQFCDLLMTSPPMDDGSSQFGFTLHKSVMSAIPYFSSLFASGMSEATPKDGQMVRLVLPFAVTEFSFREFVFFTYFRDVTRLEKLAPTQLLQLLRLADYYGFEQLVEQVQFAFDECRSYACLTAQTALDLLLTIHPLQLEFKEDLEHIALSFAAFNFKDVAVLPAFRELPEDSEIYENIVEYVARAVWDKKMFVKYKSRGEKQGSRAHSES